MSETFDPNNPFEYIKKLWGTMGLPGMMPPGTSHEEIDRKIAELKSVETWLTMNLNVLQMSIKGLEVQKATIDALRAMDQSKQAAGPNLDLGAAPFLNPTLWPWSMMPGAAAETPKQPAKKPKSP
jgi:hypothetical protein